MSMQQGLGLVGGIVGSFFGYPQLGFVVGSLVGGLLTPAEKTEGPRVDDLKVQVSTYGAGIPHVYGTERVGGNVVWSTPKIEKEETSGGKGGEPENTTYRYFVHMGIVLCETPTDGSVVSIVQMFQDGRLIYDARSGIPIESALASAENPHAFFNLYQGHADQLPDPIEEIYESGPGSVPAYRGVVRIRMNAIECPGGRVPQFSFVISSNAGLEQTKTVYASVESDARPPKAIISKSGIWHYTENATGSEMLVNRVFPSSTTVIGNYPHPTGTDLFSPVQGSAADAIRMNRNTGTAVLERIDLESGIVYSIYTFPGNPTFPDIRTGTDARFASDPGTGEYAVSMVGDVTSNPFSERPGTLFGGVILQVNDPLPGGACGAVGIYAGVLAVLNLRSSVLYVRRYSVETGNFISETAADASITVVNFGIAALQFDESGLYCWALCNIGGITQGRIFKIEEAAWILMCDDAGNKVGTTPTTFYTNLDYGLIGPLQDGDYFDYLMMRYRVVTPGVVRARDVLADLCERAGETRYDVSLIPDDDNFRGYKISNPASARSEMDPMLTCFGIYLVDEDGVIKFKKYDAIAPVASVAFDELAQAESGSEAVDAMPLNRSQEVDMSRSVTVSYVEPAIDYQTASETEVRQITEATQDTIVELPLAITSDQAKTAAQMILYAGWRSQNTRSMKTSRKFAFVSPGDGLNVEYPRGVIRMWRVTKATDTGVLCEFDLEPGDAELYAQVALGATGYAGQQVAALAPPTRMQILDTAILRDADDSAGPYVALGPFAPGWSGAELFVGDDDTNLESRGTVSLPAAIGFAETALGDWSRNVVDETNVVTVNVGVNTLSSVTREVMLNGTQNVAAIGANGRWEIIKFQRASSLGSGRYMLSGLLRGVKGTEFSRPFHSSGEAFVLMSAGGVLRPSTDVGSIGQTRSYRAISKGRSLSSATSQRFANSGEGLRPLSPWNARKSKAASNDQTLTWERRTRLSSNALRGTVPLGEATESYSVDFYTSSAFSTLAGTIASNARTLTITSAQQTAFGLTPGAALNVRIYQISDSVGRGHALQGVL
jgi:hypothetical protein